MGSSRALSQSQPRRVRSIWPGYHHDDFHDHHHCHDHDDCPHHDEQHHNDVKRQVCSATDTERRSENGGDVRVAIKKIARPFQVNINHDGDNDVHLDNDIKYMI